MADEPTMGNSVEARTDTGELKDVTAPLIETKLEAEAKPAADAKSAEAKPADDTALLNKDAKKTDAPQGPPEKYEAFKVPDGYELDEATATEAQGLFKELGLSQDAAQKLVDFYSKKSIETTDSPFEAFKAARDEWRTSIVKDPTLGDGKDLKTEVRATIGRAIDSLEPAIAKEFREAMNFTGAGDHPGFVKAFYALAQRATEGKHISGKGPSPIGQQGPNAKPASAASAMYPNLPTSSAS